VFGIIDPMKLRIARHTDKLDAVVGFYRDRIGLPEIGRFRGHDGYDGVFLEIPGTGTHLEFTTGGGHRAPDPHPESLLVLYFDRREEVDVIAERLAQPPVSPANPYWQENARAYTDPDGFLLLLTVSG
jgi:catechol 2,3-dioxygenase-like lactoylglutathione lyase family enzyme